MQALGVWEEPEELGGTERSVQSSGTEGCGFKPPCKWVVSVGMLCEGCQQAALVLISHCKGYDIVCFWNEVFTQFWKRILGCKPRVGIYLLVVLCLAFVFQRGSAFLIALFLAQSASCCGPCSQKSHSPCAQQRGSLSLQESIWRSHENPFFEVSHVVLTTFHLFRPLWNFQLFEELFFFSFLAHSTIPFISIFSLECCLHLPVSL